MARHPTLTDEEILTRARSIFVERGYGARTRQISAAVGLTWGAIAMRFSDKRELFRRAMAGPADNACEIESRHAAGAGLQGLLERLRSYVAEQWPLRLHCRLATPADQPDDEPDRLVDWLAATLESHASCGSVRSDMSAKALARLVLVLLVGDVAQRFVARDPALPGERGIVEQAMFLLSPA